MDDSRFRPDRHGFFDGSTSTVAAARSVRRPGCGLFRSEQQPCVEHLVGGNSGSAFYNIFATTAVSAWCSLSWTTRSRAILRATRKDERCRSDGPADLYNTQRAGLRGEPDRIHPRLRHRIAQDAAIADDRGHVQDIALDVRPTISACSTSPSDAPDGRHAVRTSRIRSSTSSPTRWAVITSRCASRPDPADPACEDHRDGARRRDTARGRPDEHLRFGLQQRNPARVRHPDPVVPRGSPGRRQLAQEPAPPDQGQDHDHGGGGGGEIREEREVGRRSIETPDADGIRGFFVPGRFRSGGRLVHID